MRPPAIDDRCAAVVGAGPAGLYLLAALVKAGAFARIDVYESAPAPYGLIRYGVAPDHPKTRRISRVLAPGLSEPAVRYLGNVTIGRDLSLAELRRGYDAVAVATGMRTDRRLGIPGEDLPGSIGASELVAWYTGHPEATDVAGFDRVRTAAVIGAGNVALDVARILTRDPAELRRTSMPRHVVDVLAASALSDVHVIARRGPAFAKFTSPELHEIGELSGVDVVVDPRDLVLDDADRAELDAHRSARIITGLLEEWAERPRLAARRIHLHFWRRPVRVHGSATRGVDALEVEPTRGPAREHQVFATDLLIRSIGYQATPAPGLPFDAGRGVVPSDAGRVVDGGDIVPGLYVTGWLRRGPSGVVGTNRPDAGEVAASMAADLASLPARSCGPDEIEQTLTERGHRILDWADWLRLEAHERALGESHGADPIVVHTLETVLDLLDAP